MSKENPTVEDSPDLESLPDMRVPTIHECPKGHRQLGPFEEQLVNRWNGQPDISTGPVCRECWFALRGALCPTFDTGVPAQVTAAEPTEPEGT